MRHSVVKQYIAIARTATVSDPSVVFTRWHPYVPLSVPYVMSYIHMKKVKVSHLVKTDG